jgi:hypothetical protein
LASGGDRDLVPWAMLGVNLVGLMMLGAVGGTLARDLGHSALTGLLFVAYPGFVYALGFHLAEIMASALLLGGILCLRRGRPLSAALLLALAVLTRETTLVVPIGMAVTFAWQAFRRQSKSIPAGGFLACLVPLMAATAWQTYLHHVWGHFSVESGSENNLRLPFVGLFSQRTAFSPASGAGLFRLVSLGLIVLIITISLFVLRRSSSPLHEKVALVLAIVIVTLLSGFIWAGATSFMRACTEAYLLATLMILSDRRSRMVPLLCPPVVGVWALSAASVVVKAS